MKLIKQAYLLSYTFEPIIYWLRRPRAGIVKQVLQALKASKPRSWQGLASLNRISLAEGAAYE